MKRKLRKRKDLNQLKQKEAINKEVSKWINKIFKEAC